jgi:hypothetical protein
MTTVMSLRNAETCSNLTQSTVRVTATSSWSGKAYVINTDGQCSCIIDYCRVFWRCQLSGPLYAIQCTHSHICYHPYHKSITRLSRHFHISGAHVIPICIQVSNLVSVTTQHPDAREMGTPTFLQPISTYLPCRSRTHAIRLTLLTESNRLRSTCISSSIYIHSFSTR